MRKGWSDSNGYMEHGSDGKIVSVRNDSRGFVCFRTATYTAWAEGKRDGGYAREEQAQSAVDRMLKRRDAKQPIRPTCPICGTSGNCDCWRGGTRI